MINRKLRFLCSVNFSCMFCFLTMIITQFWSFLVGDNIGFLSSIFSKNPAKGPPKPWEDPMSYPAIKGLSIHDNNLFVNYTLQCGMRNYVWMTRPTYGDAIHPVEFSRTSVINVDEQSKVSLWLFLAGFYCISFPYSSYIFIPVIAFWSKFLVQK